MCHCVAPAGPDLLGSSCSLAQVSQSARIAGVSHLARPEELFQEILMSTVFISLNDSVESFESISENTSKFSEFKISNFKRG